VLAVFWIDCGRETVLEVVRLLRGRWCGSGWMIWSRNCLVRRSGGVVEGPSFRTCDLKVRDQVGESGSVVFEAVRYLCLSSNLVSGLELRPRQTDQPSW
jgi:hypothetical protein